MQWPASCFCQASPPCSIDRDFRSQISWLFSVLSGMVEMWTDLFANSEFLYEFVFVYGSMSVCLRWREITECEFLKEGN